MSILNNLIVHTLPYIPKRVVGMFAARYIAGEAIEDGIRVVKDLNRKGIMATMDVLGEGVATREESIEMRKQCEEVLHAIDRHALDSTLSIKPTQMGLTFEKEFCRENIAVLCDIARRYDTSVCIDMEDHPYTDDTLEIYRDLRQVFPNVTTVIQAYMRRSENDIRELVHGKTSLRLCKGIYVEPESIAYKDREEIRENFKRLMRILFECQAFVAIATHDDPLIDEGYRFVREMDLKTGQYEFQMLYGVREPIRERIVRDGHPMRVYVPFGKQWYPYSTRRLKENPQMAGYILKSLLGLDRRS